MPNIWLIPYECIKGFSFMWKKKEIITDYRKQMEKLNDEVLRTRTHFLNLIKKQTVNHLLRTGECEFEAVQLLEKLNTFSINCHKCGSTLVCNRC